jgi:hypothetical protein
MGRRRIEALWGCELVVSVHRDILRIISAALRVDIN